MTSTLHEPKKRHVSNHQTWAQDTFKVSSLRPSSYFYNQDKNQVLCSLKKQAQERISIFKKIQARCYVLTKLKQAKRESSDSSVEQETQNILSLNSTCWLDVR